eukprot:CAMPEP_0206216786 /NCGR_PEP_ID=MMETSP0047_2-20121206/2910_1 /ASSEMBLY_ACC=CAM_ASM_000192 /TAXON_ID=195065 /ORGANISM="Chroomonas mesostigmatica_cf, Strain CCMP1168" /LENGTH=197 /DNA_ID=CAMNT_0053639163 /DNA_START=41 /DNA_END=632 /DNA_ORIENTATION=+
MKCTVSAGGRLLSFAPPEEPEHPLDQDRGQLKHPDGQEHEGGVDHRAHIAVDAPHVAGVPAHAAAEKDVDVGRVRQNQNRDEAQARVAPDALGHHGALADGAACALQSCQSSHLIRVGDGELVLPLRDDHRGGPEGVACGTWRLVEGATHGAMAGEDGGWVRERFDRHSSTGAGARSNVLCAASAHCGEVRGLPQTE